MLSIKPGSVVFSLPLSFDTNILKGHSNSITIGTGRTRISQLLILVGFGTDLTTFYADL